MGSGAIPYWHHIEQERIWTLLWFYSSKVSPVLQSFTSYSKHVTDLIFCFKCHHAFNEVSLPILPTWWSLFITQNVPQPHPIVCKLFLPSPLKCWDHQTKLCVPFSISLYLLILLGSYLLEGREWFSLFLCWVAPVNPQKNSCLINGLKMNKSLKKMSMDPWDIFQFLNNFKDLESTSYHLS